MIIMLDTTARGVKRASGLPVLLSSSMALLYALRYGRRVLSQNESTSRRGARGCLQGSTLPPAVAGQVVVCITLS